MYDILLASTVPAHDLAPRLNVKCCGHDGVEREESSALSQRSGMKMLGSVGQYEGSVVEFGLAAGFESYKWTLSKVNVGKASHLYYKPMHSLPRYCFDESIGRRRRRLWW